MTNWLLMTMTLAACNCGPAKEVTTYRLSGNLVPGQGDTCFECGVALMLDAVPAEDETGRRRRFYTSIGEDLGFRFRWGFEQFVDIERWEEDVPDGVVDDSGIRERMVRVREVRPLAAGTRFEMRFEPRSAEGIDLEPQGDAVQIRDYENSVLVQCPDPAVCQTLTGPTFGEQTFTLELMHAAVEGGPLTAQALRLEP